MAREADKGAAGRGYAEGQDCSWGKLNSISVSLQEIAAKWVLSLGGATGTFNGNAIDSKAKGNVERSPAGLHSHPEAWPWKS